MNEEHLVLMFDKLEVIDEYRGKIKLLFDLNQMSESEIRDKVVEISPFMQNVFEVWSGSSFQGLTLTSVGIAIGHANIKRYAGEFSDLSIWIN